MNFVLLTFEATCFVVTSRLSSSDSSDELEFLDSSFEGDGDLELLLLDLFLSRLLTGDGVLSFTFLSGDFGAGEGDLLLSGLFSFSSLFSDTCGDGVLSLTILLSSCATGEGDLLFSISEAGDSSVFSTLSGDFSLLSSDFSCCS